MKKSKTIFTIISVLAFFTLFSLNLYKIKECLNRPKPKPTIVEKLKAAVGINIEHQKDFEIQASDESNPFSIVKPKPLTGWEKITKYISDKSRGITNSISNFFK